MAIKINDALRTKMVNTVVGYLSGTAGTSGNEGMLRVYGGIQPDSGGGTAGTQAILVQIAGIAWSAGSNGTALITASKTGTAGTSGTAVWARLSGSDGTGYIVDGVCGTAVTDTFVIDNAAIAGAAVVTLSAATIIQPGS